MASQMVGRLTVLIKRHAFPLTVLAASLAVSAIEWKHARDDEYREAQTAFTQIAQAYEIQLDRRMKSDFHFLADLSVHIETGAGITRNQFAEYINRANQMKGSRAIQRLGYLPLRSAGVGLSQGAGAPASDNQPQKPEHANANIPLFYVYPADGSAHAPVLDAKALNAPAVRTVWQRARDTGEAVVTGKLENGLIGAEPPSFLIFAPVYRGSGPLDSVARRRAAFQGLVYEFFRPAELLWSAWGGEYRHLMQVRFAVEGARGQFSPLYDSMRPAPPQDSFLFTGRFYAAGRAWLLSLRSPVSAYMNPVEQLQLTPLLGGLFVSLLLTALSALWSERQRTAKSQQEQNQRFRSLFDQNPDAVYSLDLNGCFTTANRQTEILAGKPAEQLLDICVRDLIAPDKREESLERLHLALRGQPTYGETAIIMPHGERIELAVTHLPIIVNGRRIGVFGIAKDINDRKRAEAELQETRAKLEDRVRERTAALRQEVEARKQEVDARKQTEAALRDLTDHLQNIREDERARIAREIHDELGGSLAAIRFDLSAPIRRCSSLCDRVLQRNKDSLRLVDNAIASLRRIIANLRPSMLDDLGLWATLEWLASEFTMRLEIPVRFDLEGEEVEVPPGKATAIFRIVQESLNNVAKHARASRVEILATTTSDAISIVVQDNGRGFAPDAANRVTGAKTYGLLGMQERAQAFNGSVEIASQLGRGTTVSIEFPV